MRQAVRSRLRRHRNGAAAVGLGWRRARAFTECEARRVVERRRCTSIHGDGEAPESRACAVVPVLRSRCPHPQSHLRRGIGRFPDLTARPSRAVPGSRDTRAAGCNTARQVTKTSLRARHSARRVPCCSPSALYFAVAPIAAAWLARPQDVFLRKTTVQTAKSGDAVVALGSGNGRSRGFVRFRDASKQARNGRQAGPWHGAQDPLRPFNCAVPSMARYLLRMPGPC